MALIVAYCVWSIYLAIAAPNPQIAQYTEVLGEDVEGLVQLMTVALYAVVMVASGIFQGLNARYYFVRVSMIRDYVQDTPQWVLDLQRSAAKE